MKANSGWIMARGQIGWILGLIVSTAIVIQLERLEIGARLGSLDANPLAEAEPAWSQALHDLRAQTPDPANAAPQDQAALLLALSLAGLQEGANTSQLAAEVTATIDAIGLSDASDPLVIEATEVARRVFNQ